MRLTLISLVGAILVLLPTSQPPAQLNNSVDSAKAQQVQANANEIVSDQQELSPQPVKLATEPEQIATTCADEVQRYGWNTSVAYEVMMAESSNNPDNHNDDSHTGDYSIGCFQINLLGDANLRAKYRDAVRNGYTGDMTVASLETWLKVAKNNVAVAYTMWNDQGWKPWGATTCAYKVHCY